MYIHFNLTPFKVAHNYRWMIHFKQIIQTNKFLNLRKTEVKWKFRNNSLVKLTWRVKYIHINIYIVTFFTDLSKNVWNISSLIAKQVNSFFQLNSLLFSLLMCRCSNLYHVYNNNCNNNYSCKPHLYFYSSQT